MRNSIEKTLSFEHGAWYLGILTVVLVLLGGAVFYRRDVNSWPGGAGRTARVRA